MAPRSKPAEAADASPADGGSSIFGGAKPVDTAKKEHEIEERLADGKEERRTGGGASSSIFGGAKPVDTLQKEREIEEKLEAEKAEKREFVGNHQF